MIDRVKSNLTTGLTRIKWIATFLAERTKAETSIAKLLYESSKLEDKINGLYSDIGRRVMELKDKGEHKGKDVYSDFVVQHALDEIRELKAHVDDYKNQARNTSKIPE